MKKLMIVLACALALGLTPLVAGATELTFGDQYYIGHINDGIPSSPADEVSYINNLITLGTEQPVTPIGTEAYDRLDSALVASFPTAVITDNYRDESGNNLGIDVTGYKYLLAKYDAFHAGSYVWDVSGLTGEIAIPAADPPCGQYGLSHYSLYNYKPPTVPDGGATVMLLGGALVAIAAFRRKFNV